MLVDARLFGYVTDLKRTWDHAAAGPTLAARGNRQEELDNPLGSSICRLWLPATAAIASPVRESKGARLLFFPENWR
jgi:hypothetical protein